MGRTIRLLVLSGWMGYVVFSNGIHGGGNAMASLILKPQSVLEAIVITEAAGEPYRCKVGVAEVLRNRGWNLKGFAGIKRKDLQKFLSRQPEWVHQHARRAIQEAESGSNFTQHATHFENVEAFGFPAWARDMEMTAKIGRLTFFRSHTAV